MTSPEELSREFAFYGTGWSYKVTHLSIGDVTGNANVNLLAQGAEPRPYTTYHDKKDGGWRVCTVDRGSTSFDAG